MTDHTLNTHFGGVICTSPDVKGLVMALQPEDVRRLNERAREVGNKIGWELEFCVAPNPEYVGLTAGSNHVFVRGPSKLSALAAHDIELDLDALERGEREIIEDEDGDPRFI